MTNKLLLRQVQLDLTQQTKTQQAKAEKYLFYYKIQITEHVD